LATTTRTSFGSLRSTPTRFLPSEYGGEVEFSEYLGLDKQLYRDIKLAYRQGGMKRSMSLFEGSQWFMGWLKLQGFEVWIATTRPYLRLDNIDPDTQFWLERYGIQYDYLIYGEDKYKQLVSRVDQRRIVAVVDDLKEQCILAADVIAADKIWTPRRPHNQRQRWTYSFDSWNEMGRWLQKEKESWDASVGSSVHT
jgi:hypothetical protein